MKNKKRTNNKKSNKKIVNNTVNKSIDNINKDINLSTDTKNDVSVDKDVNHDIKMEESLKTDIKDTISNNDINSSEISDSYSDSETNVDKSEKVIYDKLNQIVEFIKNNMKKIIITTGALSAFIIIFYSYKVYHYSNHFMKNSYINGVNVSNLNLNDSIYNIKRAASKYALQIQTESNFDMITADMVNLRYNDNANVVKDILKEQNKFLWFIYNNKDKNYNSDNLVIFDANLFDEVFKTLNVTLEISKKDSENIPVISEYKKGEKFVIQNGDMQVTDINKIKVAIDNGLRTLAYLINCDDPAYLIDANSNNIRNVIYSNCELMNKFISSKIDYADNIYIDSDIINRWIKTNEEGKVYIDENSVKSYLSIVNDRLNKAGNGIEFKTKKGDTIVLNGGNLGKKIDIEKETKEVVELIAKGEAVKKEPNYVDGNISIDSDYIEVNLDAQKAYVFVDNSEKMSFDIVSGNPKKSPSKTGAYSLKQLISNIKEGEHTVLNYYPIDDTFGFSQSDWRKSYGKEIYKSDGTNGNINLSSKDFEKLKNLVKNDMPVLIYNKSANSGSVNASDNKTVENMTDNKTEVKTEVKNKNSSVKKKPAAKDNKNVAVKENNKNENVVNNNDASKENNSQNDVGSSLDVKIIPSKDKYDKNLSPIESSKQKGPGIYTGNESIKAGVYNSDEPPIRSESSRSGPGVQ